YSNVLLLPLPLPATAMPAAIAPIANAASSTETTLCRDMLPPPVEIDRGSLSCRHGGVGFSLASVRRGSGDSAQDWLGLTAAEILSSASRSPALTSAPASLWAE